MEGWKWGILLILALLGLGAIAAETGHGIAQYQTAEYDAEMTRELIGSPAACHSYCERSISGSGYGRSADIESEWSVESATTHHTCTCRIMNLEIDPE